MNKIDWKAKLSSRKLWAAVIAFSGAILTSVFRDSLSADTVELVGKGLSALCVYIFGETGVDVARIIGGAISKKEQD
ncbi:MAG: hypothetical protein PUE85_01315 [Firmicutes bacterium]|nr:hypothetical protein [Bacillota bacterium]